MSPSPVFSVVPASACVPSSPLRPTPWPKTEIPRAPEIKLWLTGHHRDPRMLGLAHCIYHGIKLGNHELAWNSATRAEVAHVIATALDLGRIAALEMY